MATTVIQTESLVRPGTDASPRWRIRKGWEHLVEGGDAPDWFKLEDEPRATLVKSGHDRSVWRVMCSDQAVYAKVGRMDGLVGRMKARLVGHAAQREWRASLMAEARGVAVPRALGVAVRYGRFVGTVFLSEGLPGAVRLLDAWREQVGRLSGAARRRGGDAIITAVAKLLSEAHARGFLHGDGHPENILLCPDVDQGWRALFVDVQSARFSSGPVSRARRLEALAELDQSFHRHATRCERLRFLRRYFGSGAALEVSEEGHSELRSFVDALPRVSSAHAARLARQRDRRVWRQGKYFATVVLPGGWSATVVLALERRHLFREPEVADRSRGEWRRILLGVVDGIDAGRCAQDDAARFGLDVEVRRFRGWLSCLAPGRSRSNHRRQFEDCHRARHRDEARDLILAYGVRRQRGLVRATFLIRPRRGQDDAAVETA